MKAKEGAREAYQHRPRAFAAPKPDTTTGPIFGLIAPGLPEAGDGFQQVTRKRARVATTKEGYGVRGRPTFVAAAGKDLSQTRLNLLPVSQAPGIDWAGLPSLSSQVTATTTTVATATTTAIEATTAAPQPLQAAQGPQAPQASREQVYGSQVMEVDELQI